MKLLLLTALLALPFGVAFADPPDTTDYVVCDVGWVDVDPVFEIDHTLIEPLADVGYLVIGDVACYALAPKPFKFVAKCPEHDIDRYHRYSQRIVKFNRPATITSVCPENRPRGKL